jgi:hypothetical protein
MQMKFALSPEEVRAITMRRLHGDKPSPFEPLPPVNATLGLRYNSGKLRVELIPWSWTVALAQVFSQGARKYADDNWKKGLSMREVLGCLERHFLALKRGEMYDEETGCHHGALVAWNGLAFMWMHITGKGVHDVPPVEETIATMIVPTKGKLKDMDDAQGRPAYYPVGT